MKKRRRVKKRKQHVAARTRHVLTRAVWDDDDLDDWMIGGGYSTTEKEQTKK